MHFLQPLLLGGLALAGLPVLLHLLRRQKPRPLPFPAFRLLKQRHLINRRKLQLQDLLLLLLRIALIVLLCLGLARPEPNRSRPGFSGDQPVHAVLVFDTSASMGYSVGRQTRLDDAKNYARELLAEIADSAADSRVAVLDSADGDGGAVDLLPLSAALARIDGLRLRPSASSLQPAVKRAFDVLREAGQGPDPPPRFLYVFSDRTRASWDPSRAESLNRPDGVACSFVDVGVDDPRDLAIDAVEVEPAVAPPGGRVVVRVTVRAVGGDYENELHCTFDNDPDPESSGERQKTVKVAKGETQTVSFLRHAPSKIEADADFPCQVTVRLATTDALPFNNVRYATFLVRKSRQALAIADDERAAADWKSALEAVGVERPADAFHCQVRIPAAAEALSDEQLNAYKVVCLFQTAAPSERLWARLADYVRKGGGLVIVPPGEEVQTEAKLKAFNDEGDKAGLLPAKLVKIVSVPAAKPGVPWEGFDKKHALTAPFRRWSEADTPDLERPDVRPVANAYWAVEPFHPERDLVVAHYRDEASRPSLVEREVGRGRVILFTTVLDGRLIDRNRPWNNYFSETWFGLVLINETCRYLAGDAVRPRVEFACGQEVEVKLPHLTPHADYKYRLHGPELSESEGVVSAAKDAQTLALKQAAAPGNYTVSDEKDRLLAGVSLNVRPEENLLDRVPALLIEQALGDDSLLAVDRAAGLGDAFKGRSSWWDRLLSWVLPGLMLLALLALTAETVLANKVFHRAPAPLPEAAP
jgi:hypothetical protein